MRVLIRFIRAALAAALGILLLALVPLLLWHSTGSPVHSVVRAVPADWVHPDSTDLRNVLVGLLSLVCWVSWFRLAAALVVEALCTARHLPGPRLRVLGGAQALASAILGVLLLVGSQPGPRAEASGGPLAVTVHPAGVELAWSDSAFVLAGAAAAVAIKRKDRRRQVASADVPLQLPPEPSVVRSIEEPAWRPLEPSVARDDERHGLASVRALLDGGAAAVVVDAVQAPLPEDDPTIATPPVPTVRPGPSASAGPALTPIPEWVFLVRVLGPVDVLGNNGERVTFERSKSVEFLTWVALHRRSATRDAARTALWESDVRDASFSNVVSEARRALSRHCAPMDHREWIGRPRGELIPLHPAVICDVDLFRIHVSRSEALRRHDADAGAIAAELRSALDLVRGAPFIGSGFGWADAEASTSGFTMLVVSAAQDLAEVELAAGNVEDALSVTGIGLTVLPGHEELVALRLRAHARAGDIRAIQHEWTAYLRSLANDPWQSEPSTWLGELVQQLVGEPEPAA